MTRVYVAVAVAVAAGLLFFLPRLDGADGYTDEDYRFRLERPGPGWRFLHCLPRHAEEVADEVFYSKGEWGPI